MITVRRRRDSSGLQASGLLALRMTLLVGFIFSLPLEAKVNVESLMSLTNDQARDLGSGLSMVMMPRLLDPGADRQTISVGLDQSIILVDQFNSYHLPDRVGYAPSLFLHLGLPLHLRAEGQGMWAQSGVHHFSSAVRWLAISEDHQFLSVGLRAGAGYLKFDEYTSATFEGVLFLEKTLHDLSQGFQFPLKVYVGGGGMRVQGKYSNGVALHADMNRGFNAHGLKIYSGLSKQLSNRTKTALEFTGMEKALSMTWQLSVGL